MRSARTGFSLIVVAVAVLATLSGLLFQPATGVSAQANTPLPPVQTNTTVAVVPSSAAVKPGDEFDISVTIDTDTPSWGLQFETHFDPNLVELSALAEGGFYKDWAQANGAQTMLVPNPEPDNTQGLVPLVAAIVLGAQPSQGPKGKGTVATLHARVKPNASGTINITLERVQVSDAGMNGGDTVQFEGVKVQNASVAIGSAAAAPQPTAVPLTAAPKKFTPQPSPVAGKAEPTVVFRGSTSNAAAADDTGEASSGSPLPLDLLIPGIGALVIVGAVAAVVGKRKA